MQWEQAYGAKYQQTLRRTLIQLNIKKKVNKYDRYAVNCHYYAGIMLNAPPRVLCSKLCRHNKQKKKTFNIGKYEFEIAL